MLPLHTTVFSGLAATGIPVTVAAVVLDVPDIAGIWSVTMRLVGMPENEYSTVPVGDVVHPVSVPVYSPGTSVIRLVFVNGAVSKMQ